MKSEKIRKRNMEFDTFRRTLKRKTVISVQLNCQKNTIYIVRIFVAVSFPKESVTDGSRKNRLHLKTDNDKLVYKAYKK